MRSTPKPRTKTNALVEKQRALQTEVARADKRTARKSKKPAQLGERKQPQNPLPAQHQRKPGYESDLDPAPRFLAPTYKGSEKLLDKVALITGGDSGIGRSVAVLYAREGADVAIVYLSETDDAKETKRHVEKEGRRCLLIEGDVRDPDFCDDAVKRTIAKFGKLDILVNNAAFQLHTKKIEDLSEEHFDLTMKTNVYGYFHMAKSAVPHLKKGAVIINTGSETGIFGSEELLDYSTTKGAIHAFTRSLAGNLLSRGIRVNAVAPGPVWTPLNPSDRSAKEVKKFGSDSGMKRPAQPEEISPAYVFLASPACSSYITGTVLPIIGEAAPGG
ncbi:MAG TPA: SDR family oxidoreductase [Rudaea sp.]|jgi:NAD(P)-dependent dehydrogenase (short-subunit alcohol dehydrogenase family)|nr:SDR family oxidoreductase [Rudaea sp.]